MRMYRVIQISPLLREDIIALYGLYVEAADYAKRCNASAAGTRFTYHADPDPVMVTVTSID